MRLGAGPLDTFGTDSQCVWLIKSVRILVGLQVNANYLTGSSDWLIKSVYII